TTHFVRHFVKKMASIIRHLHFRFVALSWKGKHSNNGLRWEAICAPSVALWQHGAWLTNDWERTASFIHLRHKAGRPPPSLSPIGTGSVYRSSPSNPVEEEAD